MNSFIKPLLIHVDDDSLQHLAVEGVLGGINLKPTAVTSLSELQNALGQYKFSVAILDGDFLDIPEGKIGFHLPAAYDLARQAGIDAIYVLSGRSSESINEKLGPDREPDGIFEKGPGVIHLRAAIIIQLQNISPELV